jgi:hypothetical protein
VRSCDLGRVEWMRFSLRGILPMRAVDSVFDMAGTRRASCCGGCTQGGAEFGWRLPFRAEGVQMGRRVSFTSTVHAFKDAEQQYYLNACVAVLYSDSTYYITAPPHHLL